MVCVDGGSGELEGGEVKGAGCELVEGGEAMEVVWVQHER
jgi:hypothetical protein